MNSLMRCTVAILVAVCCTSPATAQQALTYADLVGRLLDLERLAVLPEQGETCAQCSSWDRASRYDAAAGKYVRWDANGDGQGIIRREDDRVVMAEMEGPGCIWRIWSALPQKGHVKIYLDGSQQPVVDMPFEHYFDGKHAPFAYPSLSYRLEDLGCRGQNLYMPIPYQKSCKIVAEKGWGNYYQFTYSTLPKGTRVPTFSTALAADNADILAKVDAFFRQNLGADPYEALDVDQRHGYWKNFALQAGGFKILNEPQGHVQTQDMTHFKGTWKGHDHLWWTGARPGAKLVLAVPVEAAGKYRLRAVLTKARDYGIVQLSLDGRKLGDPIDLYHPAVIPTEPICLGTHELNAGEHTLGVEIVGANDQAVKSYMFGLDELRLEPEKQGQ